MEYLDFILIYGNFEIHFSKDFFFFLMTICFEKIFTSPPFCFSALRPSRTKKQFIWIMVFSHKILVTVFGFIDKRFSSNLKIHHLKSWRRLFLFVETDLDVKLYLLLKKILELPDAQIFFVVSGRDGFTAGHSGSAQ